MKTRVHNAWPNVSIRFYPTESREAGVLQDLTVVISRDEAASLRDALIRLLEPTPE